MGNLPTWSVGLRQSIRILERPSEWLNVMLQCGGMHDTNVLAQLPYDRARSSGGSASMPDARRYRDYREVIQTIGLGYEDAFNTLQITAFGHATHRWLQEIQSTNALALGRHAALALSSCMLRNPMRKRAHYDEDVVARPFAYLWRAMLELDGAISSEEMNRALLYAFNEDSLKDAIARIRAFRENPNSGSLLPEVETSQRKDDRLIPIISAGSFGYTFIKDKRESGGSYYQLRQETVDILRTAAYADCPPAPQNSIDDYVRHISMRAATPKDLR